MSHFGFSSPCSFSFTFPRPPAIFNSVIMACSVGTWPSLSPTLYSRPWLSCNQHSFPEPEGRMEAPLLPDAKAQLSRWVLLPLHFRKQGQARGWRPQTRVPQTSLLSVCWAVWAGCDPRHHSEKLCSVKAWNRAVSLKGMVWAAGKRWGSTCNGDQRGF